MGWSGRASIASDIGKLAARYDVIVVGSGYGGSVAAARFARAGASVCVLERGREYLPGDFPTTAPGVSAATRVDGSKPIGRRDALFQFHVGEGITVLTGCGLGGGSLVNSGIIARPDPAVLRDMRWPAAIRNDADGALAAGFDRAWQMLNPQVYPENAPLLRKASALDAAAIRVGGLVQRMPMCVSFETGPNQVGVEVEACTLCGECNAGCNHNAKGTLGVNYLADAVAHGAALFAGVEVRQVLRAVDGDGWAAQCRVSGLGRERFGAPEVTLRATVLVLAAGVVGTTGLLLRSRAGGLTTSDRLGERLSGNGNVLGFAYDTGMVRNCAGRTVPNEDAVGPGITAALHAPTAEVDVQVAIEDGAHPQWAADPMAGLLLALSFKNAPASGLRRVASRLANPRAARAETMNLLAMSHDDAAGRITLEAGEVRIVWPDGERRNAAPAVAARLREVAGALEGDFVQFPTSMTVQPLGGCVMADRAEDGVVDAAGRVFASAAGDQVHDGLYVVDASVIPRSLGINPVWTIAALAERTVCIAVAERHWDAAGTRRQTTPPERATSGVRFTERMVGQIAQADGDAGSLSLLVTIHADRTATGFAPLQERPMRFAGTADAPLLSPRRLTVTDGRFVLFERVPELSDAWRMTYACRLHADDGRTFTLRGEKAIEADAQGPLEFWRDTTRLAVEVFAGETEDPEPLARGVLIVHLADFVRQMTTVRPVPGDSPTAPLRFGIHFLHRLGQVYNAVARPDIRVDAGTRWQPLRPLRAPEPQTFHYRTPDGARLALRRYPGGTRGPVVLLHGYSSTFATFDLDSTDENLVEQLVAHGFDVWLQAWRSNGAHAEPDAPFWLDDVAQYDHPAALERICALTGAESVHVIAHCLGAQTLFMSLLRHGLRARVRSVAALQVAAHWDSPPLLGLKVQTRFPDLLNRLGAKSVPSAAFAGDGFGLRVLDAALSMHPRGEGQRCRNPTCRRAAALFGEIVRHENLNAATHDRMAQHIGLASVRPFIQMAAIARRGEIVDRHGQPYLRDLTPLKMPITFLHGECNQVVGQGATGRTWQLLRETFGDDLYRRIVLPGYGHNDAFIGRRAARDVFPHLVAHLERAEQST